MVTTVRNRDLADVLFGKTRQALLALFFTRPDETFHLRQVVRLTGCGIGPVQRDLAVLSGCGILRRERRGVQVFYSANPDCPVHDELKGLTVKTTGLADLLRRALESLAHAVDVAFLFGSFARGEHHMESDVDVIVVSPSVKLGELVEAFKPVETRLGREVNPVLYRPDEWRQKVRAKHHFVLRIQSAPKLFLIGGENELVRLAE